VVHVGTLSVVVRSARQIPQQLPPCYELHGSALDVCRQIMTQISSSTTESYKITVTKDAVDDDAGASFSLLKLRPASSCFVVGDDNVWLLFIILFVNETANVRPYLYQTALPTALCLLVSLSICP